MNYLTVQTGNTDVSLHELAANNDVNGFKRLIDRDACGIDAIGLWYGRQKGSRHMVLQDRTPLMVAATYGSIDVIRLILSLSVSDVNQSCGLDKTTALHCAASSGCSKAVDAVKLLLFAGADPNMVDTNGHRPADIIVPSLVSQNLKICLEELLTPCCPGSFLDLRVSTETPYSDCPSLSWFPENRFPVSMSDSTFSPKVSDFNKLPLSFASDKKEYPVDPSLPGIKNSISSTDEFRMFSFKVRPCSRAYSHDWTECPFVHPGENARRRDPRKYHYSCVPCPDFRKGTCGRGDMCEYAHGVFECWLHPAQYRTRLCKDGTNCNRRVCFFAHKNEELRPPYVSTGSAVPSTHSSTSATNGMDIATAMSVLPGSPSSISVMSPSPFTPPMYPSANGHSILNWHQANVPSLHLPGKNLQSSRLRLSLNNTGDLHAQDLNMLPNFDMQHQQLLNEFSRLSHLNANSNTLSRYFHSKIQTPSNLEGFFSPENLSPHYPDQTLASSVYSPRHNSSVLNQFQQKQNVLSPIRTNFSANNAGHSRLHPSFTLPSGNISSQNVEPISPVSSRVSRLSQQENHQHQFRSLSSRDLGYSSSVTVGSSVDSWSNWGSANGEADWAVNTNDFGGLRRTTSFDNFTKSEEPEFSWVQLLVKEPHTEMKEKTISYASDVNSRSVSSIEGETLNSQVDNINQSVLGAWIEQMQLDQLLAQCR